MRITIASVFLAVLGLPATSLAQSTQEEVEPPPPVVKLERLPPRVSYELGIQMSYGAITYYRDEVPPWAGFGIRMGWGRNFGLHRIGLGGNFQVEGPLPVHYTLALEPHVQWDYITEKSMLFGASLGPSFLLFSKLNTLGPEVNYGVSPALAVRAGVSQGWTRVGRRVFVYVEPKVRWIDNAPNWIFTLVVGQGKGR